MADLLFKVSNWLKGLVRRKDLSYSPKLLDFNKNAVTKKLHDGWRPLYERRVQDSWQILMNQAELIKNIYVLDLAAKPAAQLERHKGRIEAIEALIATVHGQLAIIEARAKSDGKVTHNEAKIAGPKRERRRPMSAAISL